MNQSFLRTLVGPEDADIDVVAVHGLNPKNTLQHAEATWMAGDKLWLRDFFPHISPKTRIMLFGYNANVAFETSAARIREQAENLLNWLKIERKNDPERILVFLCHSMGGIVVKRALVHAKSDESYETIRTSTSGLVFFATPHRGGNGAAVGDIAAKIARGVLLNPGNTFMEALKRNSIFAETLIDDFRQQLEDYPVLSFYETRPMGKLGIIVDKRSATLGLPGTREIQIGLDADHRDVCKFKSAEDAAFKQVSQNLLFLLEAARTAKKHHSILAHLRISSFKNDAKAKFHSSGRVRDIKAESLRSLWFPEMGHRVHDIEKVADNTCEWLRGHPSYRTWLRDPSALLWIKGKPGSGKSTLMKHIFQRDDSREVIRATFFFNARGSQIEHQPIGLYRSLLYQLLGFSESQSLQFAEQYIENKYTKGEYGVAWEWHTEELRDRLTVLLKSLSNRQVHLYIDALDEGGEEPAIDLANYFDSLVAEFTTHGHSLHVCFSCRHYPFVALNGLSVVMEKMNSADIREFVKQKLCDENHRYSDRLTLVDSIIQSANGVFQWAVLVVSRILASLRRGKSINLILREVQRLPAELHKLYTSLMSDIPEDERWPTLCLLRWLCFSSKALTLEQIRWIIAMDAHLEWTSMKDWRGSDYFCQDNYDLANRITDMTRGLVEIKARTHRQPGIVAINFHNRYSSVECDDVVQFIHQSVKDFLIEKNYLETLETEVSEKSSLLGRGHFHLARSCTRYLCCEAVIDIELKYATRSKEYQRPRYQNHSPKYEKYEPPKLRKSQPSKHPPPPPEGMPPSLPIIPPKPRPESNELKIFEEANSEGSDLDGSESDYHPDSPDFDSLDFDSPNFDSPNFNYPNFVEPISDELAPNKLGPNEPDSYLSTQPCTSTVKSQLPLIEYALSEWHRHLWLAQKNGVGPELLLELIRQFYSTPRSLTFNPLTKLCKLCRFLEIPCLIDKRSTMLHIIATYGLEKLAIISLKDAEVDINAEDLNRNTAIEVAIRYQHIEVAKVLIDYYKMTMNHSPRVNTETLSNLDISARHSHVESGLPSRRANRMTLLGYIASVGTRKIMELLIPHLDKEINQSSNMQDNTPLMLAIMRGKDDIVDFLLTLNMLDVNVQDLFERTALAIAVRCNRNPAVKMLLQHPRIDVNCQDKDNKTPLCEAVRQGNIGILEMLISHPKLDPSKGDTVALHHFVSQSEARVKKLISILTTRALQS